MTRLPNDMEPVDTEIVSSDSLSARYEAFDSFWEGPEDVEKGYSKFAAFYRNNYFKRFPTERTSSILVISCGPGYLVKLLLEEGYTEVLGIDSDAEKIAHAKRHDLPCEQQRAFEYLHELPNDSLDMIFCEQELNHLSKDEMVYFVRLCARKLRKGGKFICHGLNGANPITGAEALAQNFDHFNTFTAYSIEQVLKHNGLEEVSAFPLNLYVFWNNPANYVLLAFTTVLHLCFRAMFIIYGKHNKLWTKKIAAEGIRRS